MKKKKSQNLFGGLFFSVLKLENAGGCNLKVQIVYFFDVK